MARKRINRDEDGSKAIDSILFKFVSRMVISLVVIVTVLTLIQCATKRPMRPVEFRETTTKTHSPLSHKEVINGELTNIYDRSGQNYFLSIGDKSDISFRRDGKFLEKLQ